MSTSQEDWIYIDESLPEIHVLEIMSIEELLERNPTFVALSDEEIYNHMLVMFENQTGKTNIFFNMYKNTIESKDMFERYYKHIVYHVHAKRKDFSIEEEEEKYFKTLDMIRKNPNYMTREKIRGELQEPFESDGNIDTNGILIPEKKRLNILLDTSSEDGLSDETMRLETDKESYNITLGEFRTIKHTNSMYIEEHIKAAHKNKIFTVKQHDVNIREENEGIEIEDAFYAFTKNLVPSFQYILEQINEKNTSDLHSLDTLFQMYGRNIEEIDENSFNQLVMIMGELQDSNEEEEKKEKQKVSDKEYKRLKPTSNTVSYREIFSLFWKSIMSRLTIAQDAPLYSDIINNAIAMILSKPFKADLYVPLAQQLERLEKGSLKLPEFVKDVQLLRHFNERNLLSEFRQSVHSLQETGNPDVFKDIEEKIKNVEKMAQKTVDPEEAEEMFGSKPFIKNYVQKDETMRAVENMDETLELSDKLQNEDDVLPTIDAFVVDLPENDDDVETEEREDTFEIALEHYEKTPLISMLRGIQPVLSRIQELTNMPWNPVDFIRIIIERAPSVLDIAAAMLNIDDTIRKDIINTIREKSIEDAVEILPIDHHRAIRNTYLKALTEIKKQQTDIFFLFITYWILHVQSMMLDDVFVLNDITNSPCKSELKGVGFPIEEGKASNKGVLGYFACILYEEGNDIPNIKEFIDEYSKKELEDKIKKGFEYFAYEIESMKKKAHGAIVYEGNIASEEAMNAYDTILKLREQKFKPIDLLKPYVKSIQLLPGILVDKKERHKHILGCCQSQLDSSYQAERNLPKRLNASKNYFARERIGRKERPLLLYYGSEMEPFEFKEVDREVDAFFTSIVEEEIVPEWRDAIRQFPFFSQKIRDILDKKNREEVLQLQNEALRYLEALYRSTGTQIDKDIWKKIRDMSRSEILGMINQACFDLYLFTKNKEDSYKEEVSLINNEVEKTRNVIKMIEVSSIPENDYGVLYALLQYILCKTLCYPGDVKPDARKITIDQIVKTRFIEETTMYMVRQLKRHIDIRSTPTIEEIEKRISEIREKRKMETIRKYEQNPELNKLVKQAKLQGIKIDLEGGGAEDIATVDRTTENERADFEGAREFEMRTENPDDTNIDTFADW